jgi:hypothetical protein
MSYNIMIGYDIYDCFTMEHFRLRQRMTLTTKTYCSRLYFPNVFKTPVNTLFCLQSEAFSLYNSACGLRYLIVFFSIIII